MKFKVVVLVVVGVALFSGALCQWIATKKHRAEHALLRHREEERTARSRAVPIRPDPAPTPAIIPDRFVESEPDLVVQVVDVQGVPVEGCTILLASSETELGNADWAFELTSDAGGCAGVKALPDTPLQWLLADHRDHGAELFAFGDLPRPRTGVVVVTMPHSLSLKIQVQNIDGIPVQGATIHLLRRWGREAKDLVRGDDHPLERALWRGVVTDADGTKEMLVGPSDTNRLVVTAAGFIRQSMLLGENDYERGRLTVHLSPVLVAGLLIMRSPPDLSIGEQVVPQVPSGLSLVHSPILMHESDVKHLTELERALAPGQVIWLYAEQKVPSDQSDKSSYCRLHVAGQGVQSTLLTWHPPTSLTPSTMARETVIRSEVGQLTVQFVNESGDRCEPVYPWILTPAGESLDGYIHRSQWPGASGRRTANQTHFEMVLPPGVYTAQSHIIPGSNIEPEFAPVRVDLRSGANESIKIHLYPRLPEVALDIVDKTDRKLHYYDLSVIYRQNSPGGPKKRVGWMGSRDIRRDDPEVVTLWPGTCSFFILADGYAPFATPAISLSPQDHRRIRLVLERSPISYEVWGDYHKHHEEFIGKMEVLD